MSNSAVGLLAATISVVGSFIFIMKNTNIWIALFSLTLMFVLSVAAWIVVVLAQMARQKKNEQKSYPTMSPKRCPLRTTRLMVG